MTIWGAFTNSSEALQAQSSALGVISQNVANVNTTGYKASVDNFQTLLSELTQGTNIFGVQVAQQHQNDVQGNFQTTGLWDNLALNGPGFFVLNSATNGSGTTSYTRAGDFAEAVVGANSQTAYLTDGHGNYLMGVAANGGPTVTTSQSSTSGLTAVNFSLGSTLAGKPTGTITLQGSLPSNADTTATAAQAQQLATILTTTNSVSTPGFSPATTQVFNTGTLQIQGGSFGSGGGSFTPTGAPVTVNITDGSLQGVAAAINSSGAGVQATVIQGSGNSFQLEFTGTTPGAANAFTIAGTDAPGGTAHSLAGLNYTAGNAAQDNADYVTDTAAQDASTGTSAVSSGVPIYDTSGNTQTLAMSFGKTGSDAWTVAYSLDPNVGTITSPTSTSTNPTTLAFDGAGNFLSQTGASTVNITWANGTTSAIAVDFSKMSQLASGSLVLNAATQDGYSSATMVKAEFDAGGNLYGDYSNGQKVLLYQVPVANFTAPDSLQEVNDTEFKQTAAAGALTVDLANKLNDTAFAPGTLETSNVNLEDQFSRMITTQAAYNSATKVFQTADSMTTTVRDLVT